MAESNESSENSWPQEDPDFTLKVLNTLKGDALPNGKPFFRSYTKWNQMTEVQKNKATAFFYSLSEAVRFAVRTQVRNLSSAEGAQSRQQAAMTSANDRARFMHAMVDPINQVHLLEANAPMDRSRLDSVEDRRAPWDLLADNFNNYDLCVYQNVTIQYDDGKALNPYVALPGFETMAVTCHKINPQEDNRPSRDGAWCEKMWKEIRGTASRINENYRKSGNQDAENEYSEWIKFCDAHSDVYKYFKAVVSDGFLDNLGRALPADEQRDTGELGDNSANRKRNRELSNNPSAVNRRRQRERRGEMMRNSQLTESPSTVSSSPAAVVQAMSTVVENELRQQRKMKALEFFASYEGNNSISLERKEQANDILAKEAFGLEEGNNEL